MDEKTKLGGLINVSDLSGFSKPLVTLIKSLRAAFGAAYEPMQIYLIAHARAAEAKILAKGELDVRDMQIARAAAAVQAQSERQLTNLDAVVERAVHNLEKEPKGRDATVLDPPWVDEWSNHAKKSTEDEVRELWARILAAEVLNPGSFSKRSLATLNLMTRRDAELFRKLCSHLVELSATSDEGSDWVLLSPDGLQGYLESHGLAFGWIQELASLGLIDPSDSVLDFSRPIFSGRYFDEKFEIVRGPKPPSPGQIADLRPYAITMRSLTFMGRELRVICESLPEPDFVDSLINSLAATSDVTIRRTA